MLMFPIRGCSCVRWGKVPYRWRVKGLDRFTGLNDGVDNIEMHELLKESTKIYSMHVHIMLREIKHYKYL